MSEKRRCHRCKKPHSLRARYCRNCEKDLVREEQEKGRQESWRLRRFLPR